jgi:hypothetical protein
MAGRPLRRSRGLPPKHETRARWWREQIGSAESPAGAFWQCQRWLASLAARARKTGRQAEADAAFTEAAQAVADAAARLEGRLSDY